LIFGIETVTVSDIIISELAEEKPFLPVKTMTFLGIEFDTVAMELAKTF
jgi:hypothetical protein